MAAFRLLLLGLFFGASLVRAQQADPTPLERLTKAEFFGFGAVSQEAFIGSEEQWFKEVFKSKTAEADFRHLLEAGTPEGKCFALVGLYRLNRAAFVERRPAFRGDASRVRLREAGTVWNVFLSEVVGKIAEGRYPLPPSHRYYPFLPTDQPSPDDNPHDAALYRLAETSYLHSMNVNPASGLFECRSKDFLTILNGPTASTDFQRLFDFGTATAQCYALAGLRQVDRDTFERWAAVIRVDPTEVWGHAEPFGLASVMSWTFKGYARALASDSVPTRWTEEERLRRRKEALAPHGQPLKTGDSF